jgi:FkbM family methyltransferase
MSKLNHAAEHLVFAFSIRVFALLQRVYMRAVAYLNPVKDCPTVFGALVRCNARDFIQRRVRYFQIFEHNLTYYTRARLREGDVYLDIGANIGYFSLLASRCVGDSGKVIAVEADPDTFGALQTNLQLNNCRNVAATNVAATAIACRVSINRRDLHNPGANTIELQNGEGGIEGLPFRDIVGRDLGRVRFIKIDIEGSEGPILDAILEALRDLPEDLIIASEISPGSAAYVARFVAAGFRVHAIQNVYTIDYYLIRSCLRRYGENDNVNMIPLNQYDPIYTDYIFERVAVPQG